MINWALTLTIFVSLGGLQIGLYLGLRADLRDLATSLADVRDRLAGVEARLSSVERQLNIHPAD